MAELFIELFSEEIPANLQVDARKKIKQMLEEKLKKKEINFKWLKKKQKVGVYKIRGDVRVIDDNPTRPEFIKNILENEEKFSYLQKIYDSKEKNYEYDYRIFQIDYDEFDRITP